MTCFEKSSLWSLNIFHRWQTHIDLFSMKQETNYLDLWVGWRPTWSLESDLNEVSFDLFSLEQWTKWLDQWKAIWIKSLARSSTCLNQWEISTLGTLHIGDKANKAQYSICEEACVVILMEQGGTHCLSCINGNEMVFKLVNMKHYLLWEELILYRSSTWY